MIRKVVTYLIVLSATLLLMREVLYEGVRKNRHGIFEKYNTMFLKKSAYNVLFLGSSRAETHFNTQVFDSITKLNSFNLGVTGATPRIAYAVLKAYCSKSKTPDYLIFDLDYHFLKYGVDTIRHFPRYFPFLSNETLLQQFNAIDHRFKQFKYNPFYSLPFSNIRLMAASIHGYLAVEGKYDTTYYKGFTKVIFSDTLKQDLNRPFYGFIHPTERKYIDSIIQFAAANKIQLITLSSPMYEAVQHEMVNHQQVITQLNNIAKINHIPFIDLSLQSYSSRKAYFTDYYHMNGEGAFIFTCHFASLFQQYMNKNGVK